ncbi:MAG: hypothetical protein LCH54_04315 [Bacteroidetes bacterium]|nr:hypothetical protein [Bacteroidota bacterium]
MNQDLISGQVCDFRVNLKRELLEEEVAIFIANNPKFIGIGENIRYAKYLNDSSYLEINDYHIKRKIEYKDGDDKKMRIDSKYNINIFLPDTVQLGLKTLYSGSYSEKSILRIQGYNLKNSPNGNEGESDVLVCDEFVKQFLIPFENYLIGKYGDIKFEWGYYF